MNAHALNLITPQTLANVSKHQHAKNMSLSADFILRYVIVPNLLEYISVDCSLAYDSMYCGSYWTKEKCSILINTPTECPFMCDLCEMISVPIATQNITRNDTVTTTTTQIPHTEDNSALGLQKTTGGTFVPTESSSWINDSTTQQFIEETTPTDEENSNLMLNVTNTTDNISANLTEAGPSDTNQLDSSTIGFEPSTGHLIEKGRERITPEINNGSTNDGTTVNTTTTTTSTSNVGTYSKYHNKTSATFNINGTVILTKEKMRMKSNESLRVDATVTGNRLDFKTKYINGSVYISSSGRMASISTVLPYLTLSIIVLICSLIQ